MGKKNKSTPSLASHEITSYTALADHFTSEDLLRNAIAKLLSKLPNVTRVQIRHGRSEFGKDIVFFLEGFAETIPCACVVKNSPVSGNASSDNNVRTMANQAADAFDVPIIIDYEEVQIQRVYIVTPFLMTDNAKVTLMELLRRDTRTVFFVDGPRLFDQFKSYYPEYLADEALALQHQMRLMYNALQIDQDLRNLTYRYTLPPHEANVTAVYVRPRFSKLLRVFEFSRPFRAVIPESSELSRRWRQSEINATVRFLSWLRGQCEELRRWRFLDDVTELTEAISTGMSVLQEEWEAGLSLRSADHRNPTTFASLRDITRVARVFGEISHKLRQEMLPVESAVRQSNALFQSVAKPFTADALLGVPHVDAPTQLIGTKEFSVASQLQDFCLDTPEPLFVQRRESLQLSFPPDVIDTVPHSLLIVGPAGYGKTTFCRIRALADTQAFTTGMSDVMPVYISLRTIAGIRGSFEELFLRTLGHSGLIPTAGAKRHLREGPIRLYLDGLDEVADQQWRTEVVSLIRLGLKDHPRLQAIVTARDYVLTPELSWLPKLYLDGLDQAGVNELVEKWLAARGQTGSERFFREVKKVPELLDLMTTPLLATLILMVYCQTLRLPESKMRLYEMFIDLLLEGWDSVRGVSRGARYPSKFKFPVLSKSALLAHSRGRTFFGEDLIVNAIREALPDKYHSQSKEIIQDLVSDRIIIKNGSVCEFRHLSFQEFLAAKELLSDGPAHRRVDVITRFLDGANWWREVVKFYIALTERPKETVDWINKIAPASEDGELQRRGRLAELRVYTEGLYEQNDATST